MSNLHQQIIAPVQRIKPALATLAALALTLIPSLAFADPGCGDDIVCTIKFMFFFTLPGSIPAAMFGLLVLLVRLLHKVSFKAGALAVLANVLLAPPLAIGIVYLATVFKFLPPGAILTLVGIVIAAQMVLAYGLASLTLRLNKR